MESQEQTPVLLQPNPAQARRYRKWDTLRTRGFEMFMGSPTMTVGDIARELGCARQPLYRFAKEQHWAERRAQAVGAFFTGDKRMDEALTQAVTTLRVGLGKRLTELDELCSDRNKTVRLGAIRTWLQLAQSFQEGGKPPQSVEIYNDLRDQRQVVVEAPEPRSTPGQARNVSASIWESPAALLEHTE